MERLGKKLRDGVNQYVKREGLPVQMTGTASMFCSHFMDKKIKSARDLVHENMEAAKAFYPYILLEGGCMSLTSIWDSSRRLIQRRTLIG